MMLVQCHPTSQWVYEKIEPVLVQSDPYGYLMRYDKEIANELNVSPGTVTHALHDLRDHGIMRKSFSGFWYCPHLIANLVSKCLS